MISLLILNVCSASAEDFTVSSVNDLQDALISASSNGKNDTITIEPALPKLNTDYKYQLAAEIDKDQVQGKNPDEAPQIDLSDNFDKGIEK